MKICFFVCFIVLLCKYSFCEETVLQSEIDFLLSKIEKSQCEFIRNDKQYDAQEAVAHIKKKYAYFKDRIKTAEDFIAYSASKSLISGKDYYIKCGQQEAVRSQDWFLIFLEEYRKNNQ